jgi:hypothetical protein
MKPRRRRVRIAARQHPSGNLVLLFLPNLAIAAMAIFRGILASH